MKRISVVLLGLAVLMPATVVLAAGVALTQASTTGGSTERIPVSGETVNPCTGELVTYEGTLQRVGNTTYDPQGRVHGVNVFTFQGHGVDSSGTQYVLVTSDSVKATYDPNTGELKQTNNTNTEFISQGGQDRNFVSRSVFHITLQPDGTYTARVEFFDPTCTGGGPPSTATPTATATAAATAKAQ